MENLTSEDHGPSSGPSSGPQAPSTQPVVPQLPPQMFTTAAQLLDLTDKKIMAWLRDGRKLIGVLRSWDQFGNLVLQDTIERMFVHSNKTYADIKRGIYLVRGENLSILGEIDLDKDDYIPEPYVEGPVEEVFENHKHEAQKQKEKDKSKSRKLRALGFEGDHEAIKRILFAAAKFRVAQTRDERMTLKEASIYEKAPFNNGSDAKDEKRTENGGIPPWLQKELNDASF